MKKQLLSVLMILIILLVSGCIPEKQIEEETANQNDVEVALEKNEWEIKCENYCLDLDPESIYYFVDSSEDSYLCACDGKDGSSVSGLLVYSKKAKQTTEKEKETRVEILNHHLEIDNIMGSMVIGEAKNNMYSDLDFAIILVKFYNSDDVLLKSMEGTIADLGALETGRFKVYSLLSESDEIELDHYKIEITDVYSKK